MSLNAALQALEERAALLALEGEALRGALAANLAEAADALRPAAEAVRDARTALAVLGPVWSAARFFRERRKRAALRAGQKAARRKTALE